MTKKMLQNGRNYFHIRVFLSGMVKAGLSFLSVGICLSGIFEPTNFPSHPVSPFHSPHMSTILKMFVLEALMAGCNCKINARVFRKLTGSK